MLVFPPSCVSRNQLVHFYQHQALLFVPKRTQNSLTRLDSLTASLQVCSINLHLLEPTARDDLPV